MPDPVAGVCRGRHHPSPCSGRTRLGHVIRLTISPPPRRLVGAPVSGQAPPRLLVARNFSLLMAGELVGQLVIFLLTAHLARVLGPDGFGVWTFATSAVLYLTLLVDAGTENWGMRRVSASPARLRQSVADVVGLRLLLAGAITVAILLFALSGASTPDRRMALAYGASSLLAYALNLAWALRAVEVAAPVAAANLLQRLAMLGLAFAFVRAPEDVRYVLLWQGIAELAGAALCVLALVPRGLPRPRAFRLGRVRGVLRQAWPMGVSRAMRGVMFMVPVGVLALCWTDAVVGVYGAALRIAMALVVVSSIYGIVVFPTISRACVAGGAAEPEILAASFRLLAALIVPVCVGIAVLAEPIVTLVFGPAYGAAVLPLQILMAAMLAAGFSDNLRRVLIGRRRQVLELRLMGWAMLVNLVLSGLMAWLAGAAGAASAVLAAELVLLVFLAWGVHRTGPTVGLAVPLSRPAAAAAVMGLAVFALRGQSLVVIIPAGAMIYFGVLLLLRWRILADLRRFDLGVGPARNPTDTGRRQSTAAHPATRTVPDSAQ